ncbi:MAG: ABC transporter permease [Faecousia sp.]
MLKGKTGKLPRGNTQKHGVSQWEEAWIRMKRDKKAMLGLVIVCVLLLFALIPDVLAPYGMDEQRPAEALQWPNAKHLMGTDNFGRDIFSRIIYGARTSIEVGFVAVGFACITGCLLGAIAGFYGGWVDNVIMRAMDVLMAIPSTLLAISIAAALGSGLFNLMIAAGIGTIPSYARTVRASVLTVKDQEYIEAARASGAGDLRIILRHILPNCLAPIIVRSTMGVASAILTCASLSYIGLGVQPPTPEWGNMLNTGKAYLLNEWYMALFPGLAIMMVILALNLLGDGLRDALDPRMKQ